GDVGNSHAGGGWSNGENDFERLRVVARQVDDLRSFAEAIGDYAHLILAGLECHRELAVTIRCRGSGTEAGGANPNFRARYRGAVWIEHLAAQRCFIRGGLGENGGGD